MTVGESVPPAPGEILDTGRIDLPLSIMHSFQLEMASGSLVFSGVGSGSDGTLQLLPEGRRHDAPGFKMRLRCLAFHFQMGLLSE